MSPNFILKIIGLTFYNQIVLTVFWVGLLATALFKGLGKPLILLGVYFSLSIINPQSSLALFSSLPLMKLIIVLALLALMVNSHQVYMRFPIIFFVFFLFIVCSGISYFSAVDPLLAGKRYWEFNKIFFVCLLTLSVLISRDDYDLLYKAIVYSFYYLILKTLAETQTMGRWYAVQGPGGWIGDSNDWGVAIAMFLPFVYMEVVKARTLTMKFFHSLAGISTLLALTFTSSRGAFLATVSACGILLVTESSRFKALLVGVIVLMVVSYYIPDSYLDQVRSIFDSSDHIDEAWQGDLDSEEYSGAERVWNWKLAKRMMDDYPYTGVGWGNYVSMKQYYDPNPEPTVAHSTWFQIGAEAGYTGLIAYLLLILLSLRSLYISWQTGKRQNDPWLILNARCLAAGLMAFCVGATFISREYSDLLFCYICMAVAMSKLRDPMYQQGQAEAVAAD